MSNSNDIQKEVSRQMNNFASVAAYNAVMSSAEVDYWLENYSDTVFCRGHLRQIVFTKITDNRYKVTSKPFT